MNSENHTRNRIFLWIFCTLTVIGLVSLFFYSRQKPDAIVGPISLKTGYLPIADAAPLYVAVEKGYFKSEGVDPQLVSMKGGSLILEALRTGDLHFGFTNTVSLILAKSRGLNYISLGGVAVNDRNHKEGAILVAANSPISSVQDLKGKQIAINATKNIVELGMRGLLQKAGLAPGDVHFIEIPFPQMETVLKSGKVDAIAVAEPFWTLAVDHTGARAIGYYLGDAYDEVEVATWVVTDEWAGQNPELVEKIRRVMEKSTAFLADPNNQVEIRGIIAKYTNIDQETGQRMGLPSFKPQLNAEGINLLMNDMVKQGFLSEPALLKGIIFGQ